jgi:hypothetical protein
MLSKGRQGRKGGHRPSSTPCPAVAVAVLSPRTAPPPYVTNMPYCSRCKSAVDDVRSHRCATNTKSATNERLTGATNRVRATNSAAVGDVPVPKVVKADVDKGRLPVGDENPRVAVVRLGEVGRTPNRRSRDAYNAYQREYMRKRRASN